MPVKLIDINWVLDVPNYESSLRKWLTLSGEVSPQIQQEVFAKYLKIVKPVIHNYHRAIALDTNQYAFCSDLQQKYLATLLDVYKPLKNFKIIQKQIKNQSEQTYITLTEKQFENQLGPKPTEIYKIPLQNPPNNGQFQAWTSHMPIYCPLLTSQVIKGKGIAKKQLGFPTANLEVNKQFQQGIKQLPNGIFLVEFMFDKGDQYYGVCSVGSNPHYQDLKTRRVVQIYVFNDFDQNQFYGAKVHILPQILMRLQGKFKSFDAFLQAMHNDIYIGMRLAKKIK